MINYVKVRLDTGKLVLIKNPTYKCIAGVEAVIGFKCDKYGTRSDTFLICKRDDVQYSLVMDKYYGGLVEYGKESGKEIH